MIIQSSRTGQTHDINNKQIEELVKEAMTMQCFHHDNVLTLIGLSFEFNGSPLIVLPYMKNGCLLSYIKNNNNLDNSQLIRFALDVAQGDLK